ncbi:MAG: RNA-binding transcriptional accessory protein [Oceanospirillaceae bacterium]|nr:RNA-binding transcriptional accessory protein [Oceanospirillaceae bacterium]MCP5335271.1 RNA-binding transcriptional accessory protein [Oceanospirillaceae bacterium]MCP5350413.1 RNA-binding transcriptional accessory protein [Oceanospirillaceae bacterium]
MDRIFQTIATELSVNPVQVIAAVGLLDEGATVPFISRYRKEVTGGLDDTQLRHLEERLRYLREMEDRRGAILKSIDEQGKLTDELRAEIMRADTKNRLEDLYLPFKQKRRTKGQIAIEAGIEPLADKLLQNPELNPDNEAAAFIDAEKGFADIKAVLDGAKYILMERFSENADLLEKLRNFLWQDATLSVRLIPGKEIDGAKFRDYFEHDERLKGVPSHRALAILRGRNEGFLSTSLVIGNPDDKTAANPCEGIIAGFFNIDNKSRPADRWLAEVVKWTWRVKLLTHLETELIGRIRDSAEEDAIKVFATNLKDLLMAAPAGQKATIGLDPGLRTGVKVAVVDATGKVLDHCAIFPTPPQNQIAQSEAVLRALCMKHNVSLIAIGNGTASRETDKFVGDMLKKFPELKTVQKVMVNESGASVYSASELAAKEFPDLDVTIRGAISIARRLQDPLAELVKIDPKSIGVGQYQHDVSQTALARQLDAVVEDCVNGVGVDLNTASVPLLTRVSGLNSTIASNIVAYRDENGAFKSRAELKKVPRLGEKTFEQAAGFLRIMGAKNPLDASAVHPESYHVVKDIAAKAGREISSLMGDTQFLRAVNASEFVSEQVGLPTIKDILSELEKPGRDPRPEFKTAEFQDGVEDIKDLKDDMTLEGVVTNVTAFGAFVDIGVHQDGLVHISMMAEKFISDPREVVKAGDVVKVKVMEVDVPRRRIALSMRMGDKASDYQAEKATPRGERPSRNAQQHVQRSQPAETGGTMAALFQQAMQQKQNKKR